MIDNLRIFAFYFILMSRFTESKTISIVGAGYRGGQPKSGVENGPDAIRYAGLAESLRELGWNVNDTGNIKFDDFHADNSERMKNPSYVGSACHKLSIIVSEEAKKRNPILTIGGDHSLAVGSISGSAQVWNNLAVIWVDAHADINTPDTSSSGNIHGMPLAFLSGLVASSHMRGFEWVKQCLNPSRQLVYIGLRDVDEGEKRIIKENNIKAFSMNEVEQYGIAKVMEMAIDHIAPKRDVPIHLSFDVDGMDPSEVACTGTMVRGGLTYREARYLCQSVASTGCLVSMDITEVNPSIGTKDDLKKTTAAAVDLARFSFGATLL